MTDPDKMSQRELRAEVKQLRSELAMAHQANAEAYDAGRDSVLDETEGLRIENERLWGVFRAGRKLLDDVLPIKGSRILKELHESAKGLHDAGAMDSTALREFDAAECNFEVRPDEKFQVPEP